MKHSFLFMMALGLIVLNGCSNGQNQGGNFQLTARAFADKMKQLPGAPLLDVRTPDEFGKGHLENAKNIDWNGQNFKNEVATLDKSKPVFVYCLSGGRSGSAASQMRSDGFNEVYELSGGIMKWRAADLPETTNDNLGSTGINRDEFNSYLTSGKIVLVDFFADWCAPCKKMKPYLDEMTKDMANHVLVKRINTDDNPAICRELRIDALPYLQIYKNGKLVWSHSGYIPKEEVVKHLK